MGNKETFKISLKYFPQQNQCSIFFISHNISLIFLAEIWVIARSVNHSGCQHHVGWWPFFWAERGSKGVSLQNAQAGGGA